MLLAYRYELIRHVVPPGCRNESRRRRGLWGCFVRIRDPQDQAHRARPREDCERRCSHTCESLALSSDPKLCKPARVRSAVCVVRGQPRDDKVATRLEVGGG